MQSDLLWIVIAGIAVGALLLIALIGFFLFRAWYQVPQADEAIVIVGKKQKGEDGLTSNMTVITGGGAFVNKLTQRSDRISLRSRQIKMEPVAQTKNGVTIHLAGVALVKIGSTADQVRAAAERFASQDQSIDVFTTEQLEGALRGVVAKLSVEEVMQDRQKLGDEIAEGIKGDLLAQGLVLDSFAIQGVTDRNGYIEALGAQEIERVRREADVARINAAREVKARQLATDEANLIEQTAYDKNTAAAKSEVGRANAEAEQAENLARAEREQAVLVQRAENRQAELDADVKRVADAEKYRRQTEADADAYGRQKKAETDRQVAQQVSDAEAYAVQRQAEARQASAAAEAAALSARAEAEANALRAKAAAEAEALRAKATAEAEALRAKGEASAAAIQAEAEALRENQEAILSRELIGQLPALMAEFAKGYQNVGTVTLIGGDTAGAHIAREQASSLAATFDSVKSATGVDLGAILQGQAFGRGVATGSTATGSGVVATGGSAPIRSSDAERPSGTGDPSAVPSTS
ncbi:flotillin family protein [Rathayibacter rathayi]|uniref:Flotillin family protein n=1 Tax=Rathayibacter rathayi TaxID=33887 RepID=A0ABX5AF88_RATRA|nr:SPFH domain-containing protein [Rathayibacter rathayi]AZZ48456.1 flotillin family protein [Rathayibacter rathayi]MWV74370.1 flotillin family protein [Rathayibacter rathayi NCPPB 2980 = VKM Ac-1601]PPF50092.1 flotillin family protein [Rathayibacter rathayi]PPG70081.1 flotillin family protein [Rathayibacter rathayi]PPG79736.1 flotillin family protein [Rathayibacter rathayi]